MARARRSVEKELRVLSRSGFLTKKLWKKHLFEGGSENWVHHAWTNLLREAPFAKHPNPHLDNVIVFNRRSRGARSVSASDFARAPHEGQFVHDEIVLNGVLQIESHGFLVDWELEPGLKARGAQKFKIESQGELIKYPDAVLTFSGQAKPTVVAIEVELTQKEAKRYERIINCYSFLKGTELALFVVGNKAVENAIKRAVENSFYPIYGLQIGFMKLEAWNENPLLGDIKIQDGKLSLGAWLENCAQ